MAAYGQKSALQLPAASDKPDPNRTFGAIAFRVSRYTQDAVGPAEAADRARSPGQRHGYQGIINRAQLHPDEFFHAGA